MFLLYCIRRTAKVISRDPLQLIIFTTTEGKSFWNLISSFIHKVKFENFKVTYY